MKHPFVVSLTLVTLLLGFLGRPIQATDRIVAVSNGAALPLEQTVVEIRFSDVESFAGGDFRLEYDPTILSIDDIQLASTTGSFLLAYDFPETGMLAVSLASVEGVNETGARIILLITLSPLPTVAIGTVTPIVFHLARWYDENSVRYRLLADNALFYVGDTLPSEVPLILGVGSDSGFPTGTVRVPLEVSMGVGIGEVSGEIHFDQSTLDFGAFVPSPLLSEWRVSLYQTDESLAFILSGGEEIQGIDPAQLGWFTFEVPSSSSIGALLVLDLQDAEVRSLAGCPFLLHCESGQVSIEEPPLSVENWVLFDPDR